MKLFSLLKTKDQKNSLNVYFNGLNENFLGNWFHALSRLDHLSPPRKGKAFQGRECFALIPSQNLKPKTSILKPLGNALPPLPPYHPTPESSILNPESSILNPNLHQSHFLSIINKLWVI